MKEQQLAEACVQALFDRDPASRDLKMTIESVGPGRCEVSMNVTERMSNGHQTCHGGFIFTLADSAFAFTCNSRNRVNVALNCSIDYLAPARVGDCLVARAEETHRSARTGLTEIAVYNQDETLVARFRGRSWQLEKTILEDDS